MKYLALGITLITLPFLGLAQESEGDDFINSLGWVPGPATGDLESIASIDFPEEFVFLGGSDTGRLMEAFGNTITGQEVGLVAPPDLDWFIVFEFNEIGYVKDDEKDSLDSDAILSSIKRGTTEANEYRASRGIPPLNIIGWDKKPAYNEETNLLEWAVRAESEGEEILNYSTRILGRRGVMEVALVVSPDQLDSTLVEFRKLLADYSFNTGQKYAEYREGDLVSKYGLTALVVGGAAVGAAKLGLFAWIAVMFKKLWKLLVLGVIAVVGGIRRFITGERAEPK